jgi:hypothetical protein
VPGRELPDPDAVTFAFAVTHRVAQPVAFTERQPVAFTQRVAQSERVAQPVAISNT